jgi:hypothetical protein
MDNPIFDIIRYVAESKYPDVTKEELDFIAYNVMKEIDDEMVSKLKESVGEDLQINYPRRNAKSGMDCCRLTGINPYIEQEEQKKKRVRK